MASPVWYNAVQSSPDPNVHPCRQCPAGARCDDGTFTPANPPDSVWDSTSEGIYRLSRCPPGHILVRDEMLPVFDRCVSCPPYTYSVEPAAYGGKMWATKAEDLKCNDCPKGARYLVSRAIRTMYTVNQPYAHCGTSHARREDAGRTYHLSMFR